MLTLDHVQQLKALLLSEQIHLTGRDIPRIVELINKLGEQEIHLMTMQVMQAQMSQRAARVAPTPAAEAVPPGSPPSPEPPTPAPAAAVV